MHEEGTGCKQKVEHTGCREEMNGRRFPALQEKGGQSLPGGIAREEKGVRVPGLWVRMGWGGDSD